MSSNKKLCLRSDSQNSDSISDCVVLSKEDNYRRDSFSDRICDDLSEVILQFLSLKDKLRLECVSKQFQRTVFQKQFSMTLYSSLQSIHENQKQIEDKVFETNYLKFIESVLKKCPNLQTMSLFLKNNKSLKSILPLIIRYCDHLNEFNVDLKDRRSEPKLSEEFLRTVGSNLKYISCGEDLDFNLFPNLCSIRKTFHCEPSSSKRVVGLNLKNLKELYLDLWEQNQHLLSEVLQKSHKIRRLSLDLYTANKMLILKALKESPVLQNLIEINYIYRARNGNQFLDSLKKLAEKFPKLKSISFTLVSESVKDFNSSLRQQLKRKIMKRRYLYVKAYK